MTNGRPSVGQECMRFAGCPHDEEERADAEVLGSNQDLRPAVGMNSQAYGDACGGLGAPLCL
jgi:hypothetical protein